MPQTGFAFGIRVFSDDEEDSVVASTGIDYLFKSNSLRPAAGVTYLGDSAYGEISLGYNLSEKEIDYGIGAGYADTEEKSLLRVLSLKLVLILKRVQILRLNCPVKNKVSSFQLGISSDQV
ncbi:MAG: hypothetical protein ACJASG_002250 [Oleiphilaceae bacterium]